MRFLLVAVAILCARSPGARAITVVFDEAHGQHFRAKQTVWQALRAPFRSVGAREKALLETHVRNALKIVERSKELRGAFMKLVQILSMPDDVLPPEALRILSVVQSSVPPMDYRLIRQQVVRELGQPPERLFAQFEPAAFAAALLGQVHRARLRSGEDVVVKVQYPGVEETVDQDLAAIKVLLQTFAVIGRDRMRQKVDESEVYHELEERLHKELDYVNEVKNITLFRRLFRNDPEVLIPTVFADYSSRRVLTMTRLEGYPLADILLPGVEQALKDWVAIKYFRVLARQLFEFGVLHTDPHPGNYLVTYHPTLGMLDFGSIRIFPPTIRTSYLHLARAILADDATAMTDCFMRLGFLDRGDNPEPLVRIIHLVFGPVLQDKVFDPRRFRSLETALAAATIGVEGRLFKQPGHRVFLWRALVGLDTYLKQLGTVINWHREFKAAVERAPA